MLRVCQVNRPPRTPTQEDENPPNLTGQGQTGPSEAPGSPLSIHMSIASGAGPGGPGGEPEGLAQAGEAEEHLKVVLKPIPEELGSRDKIG